MLRAKCKFNGIHFNQRQTGDCIFTEEQIEGGHTSMQYRCEVYCDWQDEQITPRRHEETGNRWYSSIPAYTGQGQNYFQRRNSQLHGINSPHSIRSCNYGIIILSSFKRKFIQARCCPAISKNAFRDKPQLHEQHSVGFQRSAEKGGRWHRRCVVWGRDVRGYVSVGKLGEE